MAALARVCLPIAAALIAATCGAFPANAAAATLSVSPQGSDTGPGTAWSPFRTISRAAAAAQEGDTVVVAPGRYTEAVQLGTRQSGVTFRGAGPGRPVIDGGGSHQFGFRAAGADRVTIENFEITGQTVAGIYASGSRNTLRGNLIHHIGAAGELHSNGVRIVRGSANAVTDNTIHHIGPGSQAMGIWLLETRGAQVAGNSVYLVRKEGVRDWKGLDNTITGNRFFLNWVGISLNTSTGSTVTHNHAYDNTEGIVVKHASYRTVLDHWRLGAGRWSRIVNNTVWRSTEASLWIAQSDEPLDYLEVRGNLFAGAGTAFVRDIPSLRGPNVVVDGNAYLDAGGRPRWVYKAGWSSDPGLTSWDAVRSRLGWEQDGGFTAPLAGVGARDLGASPLVWAAHPMAPVASSSPGSWHTRAHLDKTADNDWSTYWMTETGSNEWVTFDFGTRRTFNHLILTVYGHMDRRNARGYRFEVSDDRNEWRTVLEGANPDASGAAAPYELPQAASGRYLRFTMLDTFCDAGGCGTQFVLADLKAGMLSEAPAPSIPSGGGESSGAAADDTPSDGEESSGAPSSGAPSGGAPSGDGASGSTPSAGPTPGGGVPSGGDPPAASGRPRSTAGHRVGIAGRSRLVVARRVQLTRKGSLRIALRCKGGPVRGRVRIIVRGRGRTLGRTRVSVKPRCRAQVHLRLGRRSLRRLRRGRLRKLRVTAKAPGRRAVSTVVRVRVT